VIDILFNMHFQKARTADAMRRANLIKQYGAMVSRQEFKHQHIPQKRPIAMLANQFILVPVKRSGTQLFAIAGNIGTEALQVCQRYPFVSLLLFPMLPVSRFRSGVISIKFTKFQQPC